MGPTANWRTRTWGRLASDPLYFLAWGVVVAAFVLPADLPDRLPSLCIFGGVTGLPCPGCGLTRSFVATSHLDLGAALAWHPFGPALLAATIVVLVAKPAGRRLDAWLVGVWSGRRAVRWTTYAIAAGWMVWAIARAVIALRT